MFERKLCLNVLIFAKGMKLCDDAYADISTRCVATDLLYLVSQQTKLKILPTILLEQQQVILMQIIKSKAIQTIFSWKAWIPKFPKKFR